MIMAVIMCFVICACESSSKSSDSKKDNKTSSSSKDKNDDDSDAKDMSGGLSDLFDKLKEARGEADEGSDTEKDSKDKKGSGDTDFRVYCHVATYEGGELVWQVYEDDIDFNNGVAVSFDYDKDTVQYNWTFIDQNAYSNLSASSPSGRASITVSPG